MSKTGCWDIRSKARFFGFGKTVHQLGWRNRFGFGPIQEFDTYEEAQRHLDELNGLDVAPKKKKPTAQS